MVPCVRMTKKVKGEDGKMTVYDDPVEMIFNGCRSKYAAEQYKKLGLVNKIKLSEKFDPEYAEVDLTMSNFKGDYGSNESAHKLIELTKAIEKTFKKLSKDGKGIVDIRPIA